MYIYIKYYIPKLPQRPAKLLTKKAAFFIRWKTTRSASLPDALLSHTSPAKPWRECRRELGEPR